VQVPFLSLGNFDYVITRLAYSHSIVSLISQEDHLPTTQFHWLSLSIPFNSTRIFHIHKRLDEVLPIRIEDYMMFNNNLYKRISSGFDITDHKHVGVLRI